MDNFSEEMNETEEKELEAQSSDKENISDIQFEEPTDLTSETQEADISENETESEAEPTAETQFEQEPTEAEKSEFDFEEVSSEETPNNEDEISEEELTEKLEAQLSEIYVQENLNQEENNTNATEKKKNEAKKYVIYIDKENIDFIEGLSLDKRREVINKILRESDKEIKREIERVKRDEFLKHAIVTGVTFILVFPILFFLVNKSLELTIVNYQNARQNFVKLYKEQGKIKPGSQGELIK